MTELTLERIAREIGATIEGSPAVSVARMAALDEAGPGCLCYADSPRLADRVATLDVAAVIVGRDFPAQPACNLLRVDDPKRAFIRALELFAPDRRLDGIHPTAVVADGVVLGEGVGIGPLVVVEPGAVLGARSQIRAGSYIGRDVVVGDDCDIGASVVLLDGSRIGQRCILHPGVVLGSDGYGYQWNGDHHHKIPQLGVVVIGDDVELGANTCIDRATLGETLIGSGSKLDNLVHIAHNNRLGRHVLLTAQVAVAGSSTLGDGVVAGGQAGIADHVMVGDGVQIGAQAGVIGDIEPGGKVWGTPARAMSRVLREQAALGKLPDLLKTMRTQQRMLERLGERVAELEAKQ